MRKARRRLPTPKAHRPARRIILAVTSAFIVLALFVIYHFLPSKWDVKSRLIVAIPQQNQDVVVAVFDPASHSIMHFSIPATTQVTASRNLGTWRLGSIWLLGAQEKIGGRLLTETLLKTFQIPADAWVEGGEGLLSKNIGEVMRVAGSRSVKSNLTLKDRINLSLFSLRINPSDKYEISLLEMGYLYPTVLKDGEEGYQRRKELPAKVISYVSDETISRQQPRVAIQDSAGQSSAAANVSQVIEALGGKVLSIEDEVESEQDCVINTTRPSIVERLADLLDCHVNKITPDGNFDIEIIIGKGFARRF